jgi:hypothetical protein
MTGVSQDETVEAIALPHAGRLRRPPLALNLVPDALGDGFETRPLMARELRPPPFVRARRQSVGAQRRDRFRRSPNEIGDERLLVGA